MRSFKASQVMNKSKNINRDHGECELIRPERTTISLIFNFAELQAVIVSEAAVVVFVFLMLAGDFNVNRTFRCQVFG